MRDLRLAGEDAYVDDIWEKLPKDTMAFSRENIAAVENEHLSKIGCVRNRLKR